MSEIIEYSKTESALAELREQYKDKTYDVTTVKGMQEAITDRARIRQYRLDLEKARVALKAPALERSRLIDAEAKRITAELEALEDPIDATIKAEQARKEAERQERIELERQRVAEIRNAIDEIGINISMLVGKPSIEIDRYQLELREMDPPDPEFYQEFLDEAVAAREQASRTLSEMHRRQIDVEAREAQLKADQEELARHRAAERERADAAERERQEREKAAEQERAKAAEEARKERERADAEAKAERERLAAVQAEELRQQREREEADRQAREKQEREAAEERGRQMAAAAEERQKEADRLAEERQQLWQEKADAMEAERVAKVAQMNLVDAATEVLAFLDDNGLADLAITRNLREVLERQ